MTVVPPGTPAPDFSLTTGEGKPLTLADLKGRTSILVFYPFAFSPVCTDQLNLYEEMLDEFRSRGADLYGVSCDSYWTQNAFKESLGVTIPQLSDWEPKGETCRAFDVYHPGGFPQRAIVILDPEGIVRWSYQAESPGELPGANLIFDGLEALAAR
jgi:peroxiredoxin (alkyl hydroperoxide reductase subunit C)